MKSVRWHVARLPCALVNTILRTKIIIPKKFLNYQGVMFSLNLRVKQLYTLTQPYLHSRLNLVYFEHLILSTSHRETWKKETKSLVKIKSKSRTEKAETYLKIYKISSLVRDKGSWFAQPSMICEVGTIFFLGFRHTLLPKRTRSIYENSEMI